jgi:hypothetical protein
MKAKELKVEQIYYFIVDNAVAPVCFTQAHIEVCADSAFGDLYETKEQAEFALNFRDMKREEKLSLPFWEEFINTDIDVNFYSKGIHYTMFKYNDKICIEKTSLENDETLFEKPLTHESYLSACSIIKKLFLGEYNE